MLKDWNKNTTKGGNVLWQATRKNKSDQITVSISYMPGRKPKNLYVVEKGLLVGRPKLIRIFKTKTPALAYAKAYMRKN